jgi:hypothetical protein
LARYVVLRYGTRAHSVCIFRVSRKKYASLHFWLLVPVASRGSFIRNRPQKGPHFYPERKHAFTTPPEAEKKHGVLKYF